MAGSADSRRSDHSGLFSSDSTDDEAIINKDLSRNYNRVSLVYLHHDNLFTKFLRYLLYKIAIYIEVSYVVD